MHLPTSLAIAASVGAALAAELPSHMRAVVPPVLAGRDLPTITNVISSTDSRIKEMTTAIKSFNGDPTQLVGAATNLVNTLNKGVTDITATSPISLNDAVTLQATVSGLQTDANALISALNDKKSAFEQAGLCEVVFKQAGDLGSISKKLIDATIQKVPADVQQLASQVAGGFAQTLQQSQQAFAPGKCTNRNGAAAGGNGTGVGSGTSAGAAAGTGNASTGPSTGMPVTAGAGSFVAPMSLVCVVAAASLML